MLTKKHRSVVGKLFFATDKIVNVLSFVGHIVSVPTTQLFHHGTKAATNNMDIHDHGCVPIKLSS